MQDDLITTSEAAELLGRSVATVNRWAADGKLQYAKQLPGKTGAYLFHRADVEKLAAEAAA